MYTNDSTRSMVDRKISQFVKQNQNRETLAKRFQWFTGIVLHGNRCNCSASKLMLTWNENRETLESFYKQNVGIIQLALALGKEVIFGLFFLKLFMVSKRSPGHGDAIHTFEGIF